MIKNVTLIGLGNMGAGIAQNILKAGFDLTVHNRTSAKTEPLSKLGAKVAASPREAALNADLVISMVADDAASRQIWLGETGALGGVGKETILIESSTLSHAWVRELASLAAGRGLAFLDAPVNGGPSMAVAGQLKMMVGGEAAVLDQARPVLASFAEQITHMGPNGTGAMTKLVNNLMGGVQMVALAEALHMAARNYGEPNFLLRHIRKDVTYALRLAEEVDAPLMTASAAREVYRMAGRLGYDDADFAAVFEALHDEQGAQR